MIFFAGIAGDISIIGIIHSSGFSPLTYFGLFLSLLYVGLLAIILYSVNRCLGIIDEGTIFTYSRNPQYLPDKLREWAINHPSLFDHLGKHKPISKITRYVLYVVVTTFFLLLYWSAMAWEATPLPPLGDFTNGIIIAVASFSLGLVASLINIQFTNRNTKRTMIRALNAELRSILSLQDESTWVPLPTVVWGEFLKCNAVNDFEADIQQKLLDLYSRINNKNNLLQQRLIELQLPPGRQIVITDGTGNNPRSITEIIGVQTQSITELINVILPHFDDEN